jgi:hypothetical protein
MTEVGALKFIEAGALLLAGVAFVWWQWRDVTQAQQRTRAERQAAEQAAAEDEPKTPAP